MRQPSRLSQTSRLASCLSPDLRPFRAGARVLFALEEIRSDIGLLLDRIVVAINAVGDQRIARNHHVFVELDRIQPDYRSTGPVIPFERRGALRLFAGRDGFGENRAL